jgi:hypothetical protein
VLVSEKLVDRLDEKLEKLEVPEPMVRRDKPAWRRR